MTTILKTAAALAILSAAATLLQAGRFVFALSGVIDDLGARVTGLADYIDDRLVR